MNILYKIAMYPPRLILSLLVLAGLLVWTIISPRTFLKLIEVITNLLNAAKKIDEITMEQIIDYRNSVMGKD